MPRIHLTPDRKDFDAEPGTTLLDASLKNGIPHVHVCGGKARCSTCRVAVTEGLENCGPRTQKALKLAERLGFDDSVRLACQTKVTGDLKVRRLVLDDEDVELTSQFGGAPGGSIGKEMSLTILFADIRGFTKFAETMPPYDVVHVLNRYFDIMGKVINRNGGRIDNYMGDGILALFGVDDPTDSRYRAVKAGLEMLEAMEDLKSYLRNIYGKSLEIGVGIHHGNVVLGAIGSSCTKRTTVIGDNVNIASRTERANKRMGTRFLVSGEVHENVRDRVVTGKHFPKSAIRGRKGEIELFEIIGTRISTTCKAGGMRKAPKRGH